MSRAHTTVLQPGAWRLATEQDSVSKKKEVLPPLIIFVDSVKDKMAVGDMCL